MHTFLLAVTLFFVSLSSLQAESTSSNRTKLLVGVAGGSGSGKTTLASQLLEIFSDRAVLISQDSYYKDLSYLPIEERAKANFDHPDSLDFSLMRKQLLALYEDQAIDVPLYNFHTHSREKMCRHVEPQEIIIVEGILLFAVPEMRDLFDIKIFLDTDADVRLLRRVERDIKERGRDFQSVYDQYLATVKPMHEAFVEPSKRYADVIIPTFEKNPIAIQLLVSHLKDKDVQE